MQTIQYIKLIFLTFEDFIGNVNSVIMYNQLIQADKTTNEELNTALYKKVFAEQEKYREWLLSQPPDEILNHCYEYTVREDIVLALEEYDLSDKQCKALLKSPSPLADVFKDFEKRETDHMDNIRDTIECRANAVIRADFLRDRREAR